MDVPLYGIALVAFALMYLAIGMFLAYVLIICLVVMFAYLALRHGNLPENYPYSKGDTLITAIFIGVTWSIFVFLGPKNPIPFVGNGLIYAHTTVIPVSALIAISIVLCVIFLVVGAFIAPDMRELGPTGAGAGAGDGGSKPKQGVGA